jgi:hypothetical protein
MKNYIGCKIIKAEEKTYGEYREKKYGNTEFKSNMPDDKEGYMVIYPPVGKEEKPHISWSPKEVFEKCYRVIENNELELINSDY